MNALRSLTGTGWTARRIVFMVGLAVPLIVGLLAMHNMLTPGGDQNGSGMPASSAAHHAQKTQTAQSTLPMTVSAAATTDSPCAGDGCGVPCADNACDAPGKMPDHSMLLMMCAMALLAVAIAAVSAALLTLTGTSLPRGVLLPGTARALPHPRPPSLLVLSISRT
ncbi:hypothetical protein [Arthrobacter russicus]|uniref:DUF2946 domain-containing protein n=1 Tax=Arthrobacter russicus TaxID=172040 RepID=A0ABU1JEZ0_9MICC|nr:hypothetical protein [Arthrobacter russicus]MDR6270980.1 hypothetical protein [Arthrobacter russicus]